MPNPTQSGSRPGGPTGVIQGCFAGGRPRIIQRSAEKKQPNGSAFALPEQFALRPRSTGQALPEAIQRKMESFFKTSFSDVRVHVGPEAPAIGALAFTHGSDLYFAPGQYNPQSLQGQQLLGHELTHVVQQKAGRVRNPIGSGVAVVQDASLEAEADRMGHQAARHSTPTPTPVQPKMAGVIQRKTCKHCGYENSHAPGCTTQTRTAATQARKEANVTLHDKSMDDRTREQQSHRPHGDKHLKNSAYRKYR